MFDDQEQQSEQQNNEPAAEVEQRAEVAHDPVMDLPEIPAPVPEPALVMASEAREEPKRRGSAGWKYFAAAVALVAMGAGIGSATTWALSRRMVQQSLPIGYKLSETTGAKTVAALPGIGNNNVIPEIYKRVSPSVVFISTNMVRGRRVVGQASGSGFVVDPRGYIVTNNHVIQGGTNIKVEFVDGTKLDATVVSADSSKDLAVLKVDPGNRSLVAAALGDSDNVQIGDLAVAIGSPFDERFTVTAGIVSGLNRDLQEQNNPFPIQGGIQTDAAINPGNSGGPLLNGNGEVIGVNTLIETGDTGLAANVGIGFAIPVNTVKDVLPTMMTGKKVQTAYLGIQMDTNDDQTAKDYGWSVKDGAIVAQVMPNTPAEKAGLKGGTADGDYTNADIIVEMDGKKITKPEDVQKYVIGKKVGDTIQVTVLRGKEHKTIPITLSARPENLGNN